MCIRDRHETARRADAKRPDDARDRPPLSAQRGREGDGVSGSGPRARQGRRQPGVTAMKLTVLSLLAAFAPALHAADAAAKYMVPRNEYGQPDLRGVWNFSSDVPLQRPKDTPDKQFQTREDIEKSNAARDKQIEQYAQQGVGAHNLFWLDYKSQAENLRSSLIIYPSNGRMPALVDGVTRVGGLSLIHISEPTRLLSISYA